MKKTFLIIIFLSIILLTSAITYIAFPQTIYPEIEVSTVTIAVGHGFHYSPAILMEYFNLVEKYSNGTVKLNVEALSAGIMIDALISNSVQFAQRSSVALLNTMDAGGPVKALISVGMKDHELWCRDPNVKSIADMTKDTTVNLVTPTSLLTVGLELKLAELNRTLDDITPLYVTHTDAYQLMITGEIDCEYVGAPYAARYAAEPETYHLLATDTEIFGMELPASLLYAINSWVETNPQTVSYVISAWLEAIGWMNMNVEEAVGIVAQFYGDPIDAAYGEWLNSGIVIDPTFGLADLDKLSQLLFDNGVISRPYSIDEILFPVGLGER